MKVSKKENSFEQRKKTPDRCFRQFDQLKNKTMVEKKKMTCKFTQRNWSKIMKEETFKTI